jgi:PIN domain nuclease of toxin-antitoxin system
MNRLLLDSHILLWLIEPGTRHLTAQARQIVVSADNVYFSVVSMWEIAIKEAKGQLDIDFDRLIEALDDAGLRVARPPRAHPNIACASLPSP